MKTQLLLIALSLTPILLKAQPIKGYHSSSQSNFPSVTWSVIQLPDTIPYKVYRAPHKSENFTQIATIRNRFTRGDTLFVIMTDTTLTEKGIWQYYIKIITPEGRTLNSEVMMAHNLGYIPPPRVVNLVTSPTPGQKAISLTWDIRNPETVVSQAIYRSYQFDNGYELINTLPSTAREYTDPVARANEPWFYFILIQDYFGYQPPSVRVHGISDYAEQPIPPQDFSATRNDIYISFTWRKVGDNIFNYRLYRRFNQTGRFFPTSAPFFIPGQLVQVMDTLEIANNITHIEYYATAISDGYVESTPGDTVLIVFPENEMVTPPPVLDHVSDASGTVTLLWPVPENNAVAGYNIYRRTEEGISEKLNDEPLRENFFRDTTLSHSENITYQVESLNSIGKPSILRTETTVFRQSQIIQLVVSCRNVRNGIQLEWVPLENNNIEKLNIYRQKDDQEAPVLLTTVENSKGNYTDTQTEKETSYIYIFIAETKDGRSITVNDGIIASKL
jgi:fibronectin type 3 domain-containing protein